MLDWKKDIEAICRAFSKNKRMREVTEYIDLHCTELTEKDVWNYVADLENKDNIVSAIDDIKSRITQVQEAIGNQYADKQSLWVDAMVANADKAMDSLECVKALYLSMEEKEENYERF